MSNKGKQFVEMIQTPLNWSHLDVKNMPNQSSRRGFHVKVFIFLLLAIYLEVPLFFTETFYVPGFLTVFSIPVLIFINRKILFRSDAIFIAKIVFVLLLTAFFSPGIGFLGHKLSGVAQTTVAIIAGILLVKEMIRLERDTLVKIFYWLSLILLVGTVLEVSGFLGGLSDSFREVVYRQGGYAVYTNEERDFALAGFNRPKFFTSEPSLLAIGFFVFSTSWLLLASCMRSWLLFMIATMFMLYLTASPVLFISVLTSFCIMFLQSNRGRNILSRNMMIVLGAIIVLGAFFLISGSLLEQINQRFISAGLGVHAYEISSENLRMVFPYLTAIDVLGSSPFFGVGISGKEVIGSFSTLPIDPGDAFGNNNLAALFIYMGVFGAFLFVMTFYQYLARFLSSFHLLMLVILVLGLTQAMGGFESPRFWGYVFIFIGVLRVQARAYRGTHV